MGGEWRRLAARYLVPPRPETTIGRLSRLTSLACLCYPHPTVVCERTVSQRAAPADDTMTTFTIDTTSHRSPNFDSRPVNTVIWALILHSCEGSPPGNEEQSSIPWLCNPSSGVSSHYYVTRDGVIYELVSPAKRAWHAGVSMLGGVWYCNNYSIGIELEHKDNSAPYPQAQEDALTWLCRTLIAAYAIPKDGIATHRQVASAAGRTDRSDPTDWTDPDFAAWRENLYAPADPLKARTLPGVPGQPPRFCSAGAYTFYGQRGGLPLCGYPLADEFHATGQNGQPCSILPCERVIIKSSSGYGVEQALISEAKARGWL